MSKRIRERIDEIAPNTMPELIMPHIELCSDCKAIIDGCKGILEYNNCFVKLNCKTKIVCFSGKNLCITALCMEQITVSGTICEIRLER